MFAFHAKDHVLLTHLAGLGEPGFGGESERKMEIHLQDYISVNVAVAPLLWSSGSIP